MLLLGSQPITEAYCWEKVNYYSVVAFHCLNCSCSPCHNPGELGLPRIEKGNRDSTTWIGATLRTAGERNSLNLLILESTLVWVSKVSKKRWKKRNYVKFGGRTLWFIYILLYENIEHGLYKSKNCYVRQ